MRITLSIDDLANEVRKTVAERNTTLSELVRAWLKELVAEHAESTRKAGELEALERSFEQLQVRIAKRDWKREDLHTRS